MALRPPLARGLPLSVEAHVPIWFYMQSLSGPRRAVKMAIITLPHHTPTFFEQLNQINLLVSLLRRIGYYPLTLSLSKGLSLRLVSF